MKKLSAYARLSILLVVLLSLSFFISYRQSSALHPVVKTCAVQASTYVICLKNSMFDFSVAHPSKISNMLSDTFKQARLVQPIDLRALSETSHEIGMTLSIKGSYSLLTGVQYCGLYFTGSCIHGFVMEELEKSDVKARYSSNLLNYCDSLNTNKYELYYMNCLHGVGHELWAQNNTSLDDTLNLCVPATTFKFKSACMSGIFMEYSKGGKREGFHSHAPVGKVSLPCSGMGDNFKASVCYAAMGSYLQYEPDTEPLQNTYASCSNSPSNYQEACFNEVAYRMLLSTGNNKYAALRTCHTLKIKYVNFCQKAVDKVYKKDLI